MALAGDESGEEAAGQLRLAAVLAAADLAALGDVLCHRTDGLVFLLQALVAAPALVQVPSYLLCLSASFGIQISYTFCSAIACRRCSPSAIDRVESLSCHCLPCSNWLASLEGEDAAQGDPGPRLMRMAALLTEAAQLSGSAAAAAVAAQAIQGLTFTSVCRGFVTAGTPRPGAPACSKAEALRLYSACGSQISSTTALLSTPLIRTACRISMQEV